MRYSWVWHWNHWAFISTESQISSCNCSSPTMSMNCHITASRVPTILLLFLDNIPNLGICLKVCLRVSKNMTKCERLSTINTMTSPYGSNGYWVFCHHVNHLRHKQSSTCIQIQRFVIHFSGNQMLASKARGYRHQQPSSTAYSISDSLWTVSGVYDVQTMHLEPVLSYTMPSCTCAGASNTGVSQNCNLNPHRSKRYAAHTASYRSHSIVTHCCSWIASKIVGVGLSKQWVHSTIHSLSCNN